MCVYLYVSSCLYFTMCVFFLFSLGCLIHCHVQFVACTFVTCFNKDQSINQMTPVVYTPVHFQMRVGLSTGGKTVIYEQSTVAF